MSHFFTLALVRLPENTEKPLLVTDELADYIDHVVTEHLARYDEGIVMPEYEVTCWCVKHAADLRAAAVANATVGDRDALVAQFHAENPLPAGQHYFTLSREDRDKRDAAFETLLNPWEECKKAAMKNDQEGNTPDPTCAECGGTGKHMSDYNPESKWDWWTYGGRWSQDVRNGLAPVSVASSVTVETASLAKELSSVEDWLSSAKADDYPFAVLGSDGQWYERGRMGWFGVSCNNADVLQWDELVHSIMDKNRDCVVVGLDLHI